MFLFRLLYRALIFLLGFGACCFCLQGQEGVVLIIADDISWNDVGCYGNPAARTPNLDALAAAGRRFESAYLTASSCSPSRSSIITGRYPHNLGKASELHQPIAGNLPWFPAILRKAGYYTALIGKHHMTVESVDGEGEAEADPEAFDFIHHGRTPTNKGGHALWVKSLRERPTDKPFFFWLASYDAHRKWDGDGDWKPALYGEKHHPENVIVPPFLVDDPATRSDLASYYNEVTRFDYYVGQVLGELDRQEILEETLVLVLADNGRPFPRAKTRLHDSGMKTFLIAHWPNGIEEPGVSSNSLVSSIDIAPTILELAGVEIPETVQGVSFAPILRDPGKQVRAYAFSEHNWHDYLAHGRSVRDGKYLYIRNNAPWSAWQGPADSVSSPSFQSLLSLRKSNRLAPAQKDVFTAPRPREELYHTPSDPNQLKNLTGKERYSAPQARLSGILDQWIEETHDDVPADLSRDLFDRETGKKLTERVDDYRGTPPGWNSGAHYVNAPGPR